MKNRTLQEWADFTGLVIACFNDGGGRYVWRGIEPEYKPFCCIWTQYEYYGISKKVKTAEDLYKVYRWEMTKDLVRDKYNVVFVPSKDGDVKYLDSSSKKRKYIKGTLTNAKDYFLLPIKATEWSKKIYYPNQQ